MHTPDTKNRFIILRSQGWSISHIAEHLHVSRPTLIKWNEDYRCLIKSLRAVELEALHESVLASHQTEIDRLTKQQQAIAAELSNRKLSDVSTEKLFALDAILRSQIQKLRDAALPIQEDSGFIPSPEHPLNRYGISDVPDFLRPAPLPPAFLPEPESKTAKAKSSPKTGNPQNVGPQQDKPAANSASAAQSSPETLQPDFCKETVNKM
jgi:hypothetical protein